MQISDFQKKYNHHINTGLNFLGLKRLADIATFDFDVYLPSKGCNLQRGFVWTSQQKQALIFTILRNQKLNPFVVVQDGNSDYRKYVWQVIDGKQRISTIFSFFNNEFAIEYKGAFYLYKDLPADCKRQFDYYSLHTVDVHYDYGDITDQTKIDLFEDVNFLGTPQDIEHLHRIKS